jgi:hypothetical protein
MKPSAAPTLSSQFNISVQRSHAGKSFGRSWRCEGRMDVVELAPGVRPARDFIDCSVALGMMKTGVGIGPQRTLALLQMLLLARNCRIAKATSCKLVSKAK